MGDRIYDYRMEDGSIMEGYVSSDGVVRMLASTPSPPELKATFASFSSANPIIPRSELRPSRRRFKNMPFFDQGQHGSCVGNSSVKALMNARARQAMEYLLLSPCYVYGQINGGRDNGANISDAMTTLLNKGTCLETIVPQGQIYKSRNPPEADANALLHRAEECYNLENWDEILSAYALGWDICLSVRVGGNFNSLDKNGCPPVSRGMGNHAVYFGNELKITSDGRLALGGDNSWGTNWGLHGELFIYEEHIAEQEYFDAFAIKSAIWTPGDKNAPPIAK